MQTRSMIKSQIEEDVMKLQPFYDFVVPDEGREDLNIDAELEAQAVRAQRAPKGE